MNKELEAYNRTNGGEHRSSLRRFEEAAQVMTAVWIGVGIFSVSAVIGFIYYLSDKYIFIPMGPDELSIDVESPFRRLTPRTMVAIDVGKYIKETY